MESLSNDDNPIRGGPLAHQDNAQSRGQCDTQSEIVWLYFKIRARHRVFVSQPVQTKTATAADEGYYTYCNSHKKFAWV